MKNTTLFTAILIFTAFTAAQTSTEIDMALKQTEPTPLQTSEHADMWLEVTNNGSSPAENLEVSFKENYPFKVDEGDKKQWDIGELIPGEEYQIHLESRVDSNAVQGQERLEFEVDLGDFSFTEKVPVEVRSDRNVISVESIDFPQNVAPGSTEEMTVKLSNPTSGQLKNIQFSLDTESSDLPFATDGASKKNLESINPGGTEEITYSLSIDEKAETGVYKLPIDATFENEAGTSFERDMTTGVNIGGKPQLQAALNTDKPLTEGSTEELTFRLVNRGYGSAEFTSMKLNETSTIQVIGSNDVYIGSMDSDDYQTASFKVNIESEGVEKDSITLPVILEYKDSEGSKTVTETIQAELYTQEELKKLGIQSGGSPLPLILFVLVLLGGAGFYWRKRRRGSSE